MKILWIKRLAAAVLFSAAALTASAQKYSGGLVDKTVAIVGNEVIMLSDIEEEVAMMRAYGMMSDKKGRCEILEEMMSTRPLPLWEMRSSCFLTLRRKWR